LLSFITQLIPRYYSRAYQAHFIHSFISMFFSQLFFDSDSDLFATARHATPHTHCISSICWNADWLQNLQDHFEQAVSCSYETVLLGHRSAQPQLIAASTINVAKAGQRYVEMLAEVVARLVKDGHGRPAAKVRPTQLL